MAAKKAPNLKDAEAAGFQAGSISEAGFNADRFERDPLAPRTATVPVPALARWFDGDGKPEWHVRGLTSIQLWQAMEAKARQSTIEAIVKAIATGGDQAAAVRKAIGLDGGTPGEIAKRLEMLVLGSVAPTAIDLPRAVKLAEAFPIEFLTITNKITELTGQGADLGKPQAASLPTPA